MSSHHLLLKSSSFSLTSNNELQSLIDHPYSLELKNIKKFKFSKKIKNKKKEKTHYQISKPLRKEIDMIVPTNELHPLGRNSIEES